MRAAPGARPTSTGPMARSHPPGGGRGHGVGTLLGCMPGIIRPLPPTVLVSSRPNRGDRDHDRAGSIPVTARQPDSWIRIGWKSRVPAANTSRTTPPKSAGHCSPGGMGGSAQSAAARARTRGVSVIVMARGRVAPRWLAGRLATTRSTFWAVAQSGALATDRRPRGVAGVRRGRVPGTGGRCAAARGQHDHSADGDHGQHPLHGRVQRPAPPVSRIRRLAMTHHRSLPSRSPSCRGSCAPVTSGLPAAAGASVLVRTPVRPRRRPRLQDWTGHSPPRFLRVGKCTEVVHLPGHHLSQLNLLEFGPRWMGPYSLKMRQLS